MHTTYFSDFALIRHFELGYAHGHLWATELRRHLKLMWDEPHMWMLPGGKRSWEIANPEEAEYRNSFLEVGLPAFEDQDWDGWTRFLWRAGSDNFCTEGIECPSEDGSHYTYSGRLYWQVWDDGGVIFAIWRPIKSSMYAPVRSMPRSVKVLELHLDPSGKEEYFRIHPTVGLYTRHWHTLLNATRAIGSDWQKPTSVGIALARDGEEVAEEIEALLSRGVSSKYAATLY